MKIFPSRKHTTKGLLTFGFCLGMWLQLSGQRLTFEGYAVEDGLAQSVALTIHQDSEGFLWIGTQSGISMFDGYEFLNFNGNIQGGNAISNGWIYDIAEDSQGNLYFATKGGLNRYNKTTGRFSLIPHQDGYNRVKNNFVYGITASNDTLFVNTPPALSIIDLRNDTVSTFYNEFEYDGAVHDLGFPIIKSSDNQLYIGSAQGLYSFNLETNTFTNYTQVIVDTNEQTGSQNIMALYEDTDGTILVGTATGIKIIDHDQKALKDVGDINESLASSVVRDILRDRDNQLWIATESGLSMATIDEHYNLLGIDNYHAGENSISHSILYSLYLDQSNNLWIGSLAGVDKVNLKKSGINIIANNTGTQAVDILDNIVASVYIDDSDRLWIGNWGKGLNIIDRKRGDITYYTSTSQESHQIPEDHVHVILEDSKKRIWIGTRDGISIFNRETGSFVPVHVWFQNAIFDCFNSIRVYSMMEDHEGKIWVGTGNGIYILDIANERVSTIRGDSEGGISLRSNLVYSILEDSQNEIWIATSEGLHRYNQDSGEMIVYRANPNSGNTLVNNFTISLHEDHLGYIWIGTGLGLSRFSKQTEKFDHYSTQSGLPSNVIYNILEDGKQNLWFSTGRGLAWTAPEDSVPHTFHVLDKLRGQEFNLKAVCRSEDGELYFGGINGLFHFFPDSVRINRYIPPVKITSIEKENDEDSEFLNAHQKKIILSHRDYALTIEFSALDFTTPEKNTYAYQMEGLSNKWIQLDTRRSVHFTNLPAGSYTFRVKGSNNDGIWNEQPASLRIIVKPPWWLSNLAYLGYFILALAALITLITYRERRLKREKLILAEKVRERTKEIERQKKQVEESEQKLSSTINSLDDMVFVLDEHGVITEIYNAAFQKNRIFFPELKAGSKYNQMNFSDEVVATIDAAFEQLSGEKDMLEFDHSFSYKDHVYWYNTKISPKRTPKGKLTGLVIVARDITERKEAEEKLARQKEELNELNITKDKFFSILAHDLKNPFANLYSMGDLLVKNYESLEEEDRRQALTKMHQASEFIYSLLENLLTWSRTQTNKIEFHPEHFDLSKIIEINTNLQHLPAETKGIKIINEVTEKKIAHGDREMISTVMRNLLNNAVKFTKEGGRIFINAIHENGHYTVRIKDEGTGISEEDQKKLFRLDVKYKKKGTAGESGTGLGLALCKEFVVKNGGHIWCTSQEHVGTTFYFTVNASKGNDK